MLKINTLTVLRKHWGVEGSCQSYLCGHLIFHLNIKLVCFMYYIKLISKCMQNDQYMQTKYLLTNEKFVDDGRELDV